MGQVFSCERCNLTSSASIFTFSEDLVLKLVDGIDPKVNEPESGESRDLNDREWIQKIECIDKSHSTFYGLDQEGFNAMVDQLERQLDETDGKREIITCYSQHPENGLCCTDAVKNFTDNIDLQRLKKIKTYQVSEER